ncbi:MAG: septum formation initiator family protein [Kiritimatiellia bacterium]
MNKLLHKLLQIFFLLGFICVLVTGFVMSYPKYSKVCGLMEERARINRRISEKAREIDAIKAKQRRFNTDREFVETLARRDRLIFPGELVFIFDD